MTDLAVPARRSAERTENPDEQGSPSVSRRAGTTDASGSSDWMAHEVIAVDLEGRSEVIAKVDALPFSIDWPARWAHAGHGPARWCFA